MAAVLPWAALVLSAILLFFGLRVHSPAWLVLDFLLAFAAFAAFVWLRYRALFPQQDESSRDRELLAMTPAELQALRERNQPSPAAAPSTAVAPTLQRDIDLDTLRAAGARVQQRQELEAAHADALARAEEAERRAQAAEERVRAAEAQLQAAAVTAGAVPAQPAPNSATVPPHPAPTTAPAPLEPPAAPPVAPPARPADLREEGWSPYAGATPKAGRTGENRVPDFTSNADMLALSKRYLQPLLTHQPLPGGFGNLAWIDPGALDFSLASLRTVDGWLDRIHAAERPDPSQWLADPERRNFLALLAFYTGATLGIEHARQVGWSSRADLQQRFPERPLPAGFLGELACNVGDRVFLPLGPLCARLFNGPQAAGVHAAATQAAP